MYIYNIYNIYISHFHFLVVTFQYFKRPSTGYFQDQLAKVHRRSRTEGEPSVPLEAWWKNKAVKPKSWIFMGFLWTNIWNDNGHNLSGYIWDVYIYNHYIIWSFLKSWGIPSRHHRFQYCWSLACWPLGLAGSPWSLTSDR